jgi:hypothetical protein
LITSAWLTAAMTLRRWRATSASTASAARICAARIVSPSGKLANDGRAWMTGHILVRATDFSDRSVHRP